MRIRTAAAIVLTGALALLTACDSGSEPTGDPPVSATPTSGDTTDGGDSGSEGSEAEPAPAAFNARATGEYDCGGQNVTVNGDESELHLLGLCGTVVINAEQATVTVDEAELIVVNGAGSHVVYSGDPEVVLNGEDATAEPAE